MSDTEPSNRVRVTRKGKGWTQRDLQSITGLTLTTIVKAEKGLGELRPSTMRKLSEALGVPIPELFRIDH